MKLELAATSTKKLTKLSAFALAVTALQGCSMLTPAGNVVETQPITMEQQMAQSVAEWESIKPKIDNVLQLEAKIAKLEGEIAELQSGNSTAGTKMVPTEKMAASEKMDTEEMTADKIKAKVAPLREDPVVAKMNKIDAEDLMMTDLEMSLMEEAKAEEAMTREKEYEVPNDNYVRAEFMKKAADQKTTKRKKTPGEYGLQLVSHRSEAGANRAWAPISTKFRTLLAGKEPVIEMATVKGKQYYRLKVGPYYDKRIAVDTCKQLVLSRQDCLVSDYYGEPF
ncbi:SPOR domain-containing protein [Marinomonas sp. PE14-40]|uniref:SPOR domain-containing protein n=1 Tax=Marinomonas sp. PE14-40 TaxID=3060621 RepID=UPI003F674578